MSCKIYRWCMVPSCKNTSTKTPDKLFIHVPHNVKMRKKWLELAQRDPEEPLSVKTHLYMCEDHFDLPNDMENYMEYHVMGAVSQIRMKPNCVPKKFNCRMDRIKRSSSPELSNNKKQKTTEYNTNFSESSQCSFAIDDSREESILKYINISIHARENNSDRAVQKVEDREEQMLLSRESTDLRISEKNNSCPQTVDKCIQVNINLYESSSKAVQTREEPSHETDFCDSLFKTKKHKKKKVTFHESCKNSSMLSSRSIKVETMND